MLNRFIYIFLITLSFIGAQINGKSIAILDFNGKGINRMESLAITNIFNDELNKTGTVSLLDRDIVKENLSSQGIDQIECKNLECISKAGASLNVDLIIDGMIQKNKNVFIFKINIFKVSDAMKPLIVTTLVNGEVVVRKKMKEPKLSPFKTKKINYKGSTDGFIDEIKVMAWELVNLTRPKEKIEKNQQLANVEIAENIDRFGMVMRSSILPGYGQMYIGEKNWGWIWLGAGSLAGILAISEYNSYKSALNNYNSFQNQYLISNEPGAIQLLRTKAKKSRKEMVLADEQMTSMLYAMSGVWVINIIHALVMKPKNKNLAYNKNSFNLIYNDILKQPEISFSIGLD